jgi:hypothetical protein
MATVSSILLTLTACASAGNGKLQPVNLPPPTQCLNQVAVPQVKIGDDARIALARSRTALAEANVRLSCSKKWYEKIRAEYAR